MPQSSASNGRKSRHLTSSAATVAKKRPPAPASRERLPAAKAPSARKTASATVSTAAKPAKGTARAGDSKTWYDSPKYYDLAFRSESPREADFFQAAFKKYCPFKVRRVLEPACGSGRLVAEMASRGFHVTAFDLSESALRYLRERLARRRFKADVFCGDMADFRIAKPVDAAFNTFDSFRHLLTEAQAAAHLRCVAESLRPGGIYILGLHLLPPGSDLDCIERWRESHGGMSVSVTLTVAECSLKQRIERLRVSMIVRTRGEQFRLRDEFTLRLYSAAQFRRLLAKAPQFELCDVYDYWYDIDEPLRLDNEICDTVFILRKR